MELKFNYDNGHQEALAHIGLTKESYEKVAEMEKEAFLGKLYQGGKALLGKGLMRAVEGGGIILPKTQQAIGKVGRKMFLSGTKAGTALKRNAALSEVGDLNKVRRSIGLDAIPEQQVIKNIKNFPKGTGPNLKRRAASIRGVSAPKVEATDALTGPQSPVYGHGAYTPWQRPPTTPAPAGPMSDQAKMWEWAKKNPVLAAGGGLLGYKTLTGGGPMGGGGSNIVVGR